MKLKRKINLTKRPKNKKIGDQIWNNYISQIAIEGWSWKKKSNFLKKVKKKNKKSKE
jgi:hypothetical protein